LIALIFGDLPLQSRYQVFHYSVTSRITATTVLSNAQMCEGLALSLDESSLGHAFIGFSFGGQEGFIRDLSEQEIGGYESRCFSQRITSMTSVSLPPLSICCLPSSPPFVVLYMVFVTTITACSLQPFQTILSLQVCPKQAV
jgi:hypothetical protein